MRTWTRRTELHRLFKTLTTNVYYEGNQDPAVYPRLVFDLSEVTYDSGKTLYQLEINIIDYGTSTKIVENLADTVQSTLNKYYFINDEIQFAVYRGLRQKVEEDDKQIIRRRLLFEIQLHEMRGE